MTKCDANGIKIIWMRPHHKYPQVLGDHAFVNRLRMGLHPKCFQFVHRTAPSKAYVRTVDIIVRQGVILVDYATPYLTFPLAGGRPGWGCLQGGGNIKQYTFKILDNMIVAVPHIITPWSHKN